MRGLFSRQGLALDATGCEMFRAYKLKYLILSNLGFVELTAKGLRHAGARLLRSLGIILASRKRTLVA
jgi:hypothetical protein